MTTAAPHHEHGNTTEATLFVAFELNWLQVFLIATTF